MKSKQAAALATALESPYWCAADARVVLDALAASGQTMAAFCREHDVSVKRVARWRSELGSSRKVEMVRVDVRESAPKPAAEVEVVLKSGRRLVVRRGFDEALLADVARAVEAWSC